MKHPIWLIGICGLLFGMLIISGGGRLLAETAGLPANAPAVAPALISFQGFLADSAGNPISDGSYPMQFGIYGAASGGAPVWAESHGSIVVSKGYFSVMLGSGSCSAGCPLDANDFNGATRYLETRVNTSSGLVTFPRQQLASAPYALQADVAATVAWRGITGVPAGFADGIDNTNSQYENVVTVAQNGGDYSSVAAALNAITDASASNPYLVRVMPGVYTETDLVTVKSYVHVQGSGPLVTIITSSRTANSPGNSAATVDMQDNSRLSNLTIRNTGTGNYGIALYSVQTTRATVVDHVVAEAIGAGGIGHYAAYWNDAEAVIRNSTLFAGGATGFGTSVNAAIGIVNISGGFPQPLIENSRLIGGSANTLENCTDNTGTGFGIQLANASPIVRHSYICGGHRGIASYTNGNPQIQHSSVSVSSTANAFLFEITSSASISLANSGVNYVTNKFTGTGTGLRCVHSYDVGTYLPVTNGATVASACDKT